MSIQWEDFKMMSKTKVLLVGLRIDVRVFRMSDDLIWHYEVGNSPSIPCHAALLEDAKIEALRALRDELEKLYEQID